MMDKEKILAAYNVWNEREQGRTEDKLPEDGILPMAYTTYELSDWEGEHDILHDIQVVFDTNTMQYKNFIDWELVLTEDPITEDEFLSNCENATFDSMIYECLNAGWQRIGDNDTIEFTNPDPWILEWANVKPKEVTLPPLSDFKDEIQSSLAATMARCKAADLPWTCSIFWVTPFSGLGRRTIYTEDHFEMVMWKANMRDIYKNFEYYIVVNACSYDDETTHHKP